MEPDYIILIVSIGNEKKLKLILPVIHISIIFFLLPEEIIDKFKSVNGFMEFLKHLKKRGKDTKILINDNNEKVKIEIK